MTQPFASPLSVSRGGTGLAAVTSGAILFGGSASALSFDANSFLWDDVNKQLAISAAGSLQQSFSVGGSTVRPGLLMANDGRSSFAISSFSSTPSTDTIFYMLKAGGTLALPTAVGATDSIGAHSFYGHDGTQYVLGGSILAAVDGAVATGTVPMRLDFLTLAPGQVSPATRFSIGSTGAITSTIAANTTAIDATAGYQSFLIDDSATKTLGVGTLNAIIGSVTVKTATYTAASATSIQVAIGLYVTQDPQAGANVSIADSFVFGIGSLAGFTSNNDFAGGGFAMIPGISSGVGNVLGRVGFSVFGPKTGSVSLGDTIGTIGQLAAFSVNSITYTSTATRTINGDVASVLIEGPSIVAGSVVLGAGVTSYSLKIQTGPSYFGGLIEATGDGTHVFDLPADATANTTIATGRVPLNIGGVTKYFRYYDS